MCIHRGLPKPIINEVPEKVNLHLCFRRVLRRGCGTLLPELDGQSFLGYDRPKGVILWKRICVLWIEPCKPGYTLAKICYDTLKEHKEKTGKDADMLLLANHGIFIADNTTEGLGDKLYSVMAKLRNCIEEEPDFSIGDFDGEKGRDVFNEMCDVFGEDSVITYEPSATSLEFAKSEEDFNKIYLPFNPDQIVYCKPYPVYIENIGEIKEKVEKYKAENGFLPKILLVKDCGLYAVDYSEKGSNNAAALFNDGMKIFKYSQYFGGARPMTPELTDFIVNWEAESYRSKQQK